MGCGVCKGRRSAVRLPIDGAEILPSSAAPAPNEKCSASGFDAQGSATTLPVTVSPQGAENTPTRQAAPSVNGIEESGEGDGPQIRRLIGTEVKQDDIMAAGGAAKLKIESNKPGAPDVSQVKAPSYRVRKSIVTARVKLGETSQIYEKYDLTDDVLGTGISGAVRVAVEKNTGRKYAIKTLTLENITAKKAAMLHNEVDIYLKLDHPNIAKLIEVYEDEKRIFLVMELCTGGELYDRLAANRRYHEADAARVTRQMLEAINYCHKHRICHRDLKLENWVYASEAEDAQLKLIDFGFSRIFNPVIPMTAMHGTVYYVSPEVMDGCYREKCDIWSIGVIVYMLLSGTPPFNGGRDYQILVKIRTAAYNFGASVWRSVSQEARDFIGSLLVRDPNKRPSAEEALKHPWLQTAGDADSNEIDVQVLEAMRTFALGNTMKRAALGLVAYSFTNDEVQYLYKDFKKLDRNNTGTIKLQDLAQALVQHLKLSHKEATKVFERIDQTGDREVHYTEFVAATLHAKMLTDEQWVREAFQRLDVDKTGHITVDNLRQVLGDTFNNMPVEEIIAMCDPSGKGELDFDAFRGVLTSPEEGESLGSVPGLEGRASFSEAIVSIQMEGQ